MGAVLLDLLGHLFHDVGVGAHQVVAAHAGLARDAGRDDDQLAFRRRRVVVRAHDPGVEPLDRRGLPLIERFALRYTLDHVDEDDGAGELLLSEALGGGGAHVARADDGDLVEHAVFPGGEFTLPGCASRGAGRRAATRPAPAATRPGPATTGSPLRRPYTR